jgi:hypothetical protein
VLGLAALILAASSPAPSPTLTSTAPWWEKVTFTLIGEGGQQSCEYESSLPTAGNGMCDGDASSPVESANSAVGAYTKITIERRFTPGQKPDPGSLESGDTLLGGQVMALAIDGKGTVRACEIVVASGDVRPAYGCKEARAERFEASAGREAPQVLQGFMTIIVYGHEEQLV